MKKEEMKERVLEYIKQNSSVSYAELEWFFEQNDFDYRGNLDSLSGVCDHIVFWTGWNQEAYDIMAELLKEGKIHREPVTQFIYFIDGKVLQMPIVKHNRQYKTDHWLPTAFCKGPERQQEKN